MNQDAAPQHDVGAMHNLSWWEEDNTHDTPLLADEKSLPRLGERELGTIAHLAALLNFFVPALGAVLVLLEIQAQGRNSTFVRENVREALAFQVFYFVIFISIAAIAVGQIYCVPLTPLFILFGLYCNFAGAISAWRGRPYHYPLTSLLVELWNNQGVMAR